MAACATIALKSAAYLLTGSVGLLSDALESSVNLVAAVIALIALRVAARPADASHPFGHGKVEYLAAGAEGLMIVIAAIVIVVSAVARLLDPRPLDDLGLGLVVTGAATVLNAVVGVLIVRAGRRHRSWTLVADGQHLLTDVWTSIGVVVGVGLVLLTGWQPLDSLVALAVAANIVWVGWRLVRQAGRGLMDHALPAEDEAAVRDALAEIAAREPDIAFHGLQTREAGRERFVVLHVLVPGAWTVARGHDLLEEVEHAVARALPATQTQTHLEPREDPRAYERVSTEPPIDPAH